MPLEQCGLEGPVRRSLQTLQVQHRQCHWQECFDDTLVQIHCQQHFVLVFDVKGEQLGKFVEWLPIVFEFKD